MRTQARIASLIGSLGDSDEAEKQLREVLAVQESHLGREHPDTTSTQEKLARHLFISDDPRKQGPSVRFAGWSRRPLEGSREAVSRFGLQNKGTFGFTTDPEPSGTADSILVQVWTSVSEEIPCQIRTRNRLIISKEGPSS